MLDSLGDKNAPPFYYLKGRTNNFVKQHLLNFIKRLIAPTSYEEDKARQEYILNILLISLIFLIAIGSLIIIYRLIFPPETGYQNKSLPLIIVITVLIFFIALYFLSKKGLGKMVSYVFIALIFSLAFYQGFLWGVDLPASLLFYTLGIIISGIILGTKKSFFFTSLAILLICLSANLQKEGLVIADRSWINDLWGKSDVLVTGVIFLIIASVSWLYNKELNKSLKKLRRSERLLVIERDLLETRVAQKTKELRIKQAEEIAQVYRFAEIGKLSSGLFHDLVNPLTSVMLNIHKIKMDGENNPNLNFINEEINQAIKVSEKMRNFINSVRKQIKLESYCEKFSLSKEISEALEILNYKIKKNKIQINYNYKESLFLDNDSVKFNQIVTNILANAIDSFDDLDKADKIINISLTEDDENIILTISDNGQGIKAENINQIFNSFFTTKKHKDNLGIGLSLVKKIIEESFMGKIEVHSDLNIGTKFIIVFPKNKNENNR